MDGVYVLKQASEGRCELEFRVVLYTKERGGGGLESKDVATCPEI